MIHRNPPRKLGTQVGAVYFALCQRRGEWVHRDVLVETGRTGDARHLHKIIHYLRRYCGVPIESTSRGWTAPNNPAQYRLPLGGAGSA